jgi:hypothetical protein
MDSKEGMDLAKMAVSVLLVVLVIGAVVAVVYAAYSWFGSGTDKLGDQVNSIDASSYAQYDATDVPGTDVLTALKTYRDSDVAILICNNNAGGYKNYCAILGTPGTDAATPKTGTIGDTGFTVNDTSVIVKGDLDNLTICWNNSTGLSYRNTDFSVTTDKSKGTCYVKQSAMFRSDLVYDVVTGEVCGIKFLQKGASDTGSN